MKSIFKFILSAAAISVAPTLWAQSAIPTSPTLSEADIVKQLTDQTMWRMVWVKDFEIHDLPHVGLAPKLETYIRSVSIHTAIIDGKLMTVRASAGCNGMGRNISKRIVTPAKTTETLINGTPHYKRIPATFKTQLDGFYTTQKACSFKHKIDGQAYDLSWPSLMEGFILENVQDAVHSHNDNVLEWQNEDGAVLARFEKLPLGFSRKHFWKLDPAIHSDDPVLSQYFGPAQISVHFPDLSFHRGCERLFANFDMSEGQFIVADKFYIQRCESLSSLAEGQRYVHIPDVNSPINLLHQRLPQATQIKVTQEGEIRRLVLSDENGTALINLVSDNRTPIRAMTLSNRIYDRLDNHEWIMAPTAYSSIDVIEAVSPIRIIRHSGYSRGGRKAYAAIVSSQNCALRGLNVNGHNLEMNVYSTSSQNEYEDCQSAEALQLQKDWGAARKILFDDNHLIFYDDNWVEVMRAKRGRLIATLED